MRLSELKSGEDGIILRVEGKGALRKRITEMGFVRGQTVKVIKNAPLQDPVEYEIMGYYVSLRHTEADMVVVSKTANKSDVIEQTATIIDVEKSAQRPRSNVISAALIGNPNSGKTSLFNYISGLNEHVGNYSGVTVDSKEAIVKFRGYTIKITDLPGTYSLSSYSPEELYVRNYISDHNPDIIVNVVDASNLERNLYLTTQLIDLNVDIVVALNMYDELQNSGSYFNYRSMGNLLGSPFVPTVAKRGTGVARLLQTIVSRYEDDIINQRSVQINYGLHIEEWLQKIEKSIEEVNITNYNNRYAAIKLMEGDITISDKINNPKTDALVDGALSYIEKEYNEPCETVFADARYGFISGALNETFRQNLNRKKQTQQVDNVVTHKFWGIPIFLFAIWFIFFCTFTLGEYPVAGIEWFVEWLKSFVDNIMADGAFRDLVVDGIIGGIGSVIVFLPNILLLFLFISFLEDSGYMARAAFIMDKLMHKIGLHGKSFIPLVMGFGCNVPAIMSTRIIEDRNNRLLTMLIIPFMSCSARLPVYLLIVGAFFPENAGNMLFLIYLIGIVVAIITSLLFKKILFKGKDNPFVMELPPYRIPTTRSLVKHMWQKGSQYIQKMGGVILVAVVIVWTLSYYPKRENYISKYQSKIEQVVNQYPEGDARNDALEKIENEISFDHSSGSYLGKIGQFVEPVFSPLGFDWKLSVGLLSGIAAKEIIVSTIGVLNQIDNTDTAHPSKLADKLRSDTYPDGEVVFNKGVAFSFLVFVLIYFPCVAVVTTIRRESKSAKWAILTVLYTTMLAWIVSFAVYQISQSSLFS
ncbi:MAG: ferrous iron transport protein B [Rikenellaceae bacterium]